MRVYLLKFKGLRWPLGFGLMIKEAGTSQIFQIQIKYLILTQNLVSTHPCICTNAAMPATGAVA